MRIHNDVDNGNIPIVDGKKISLRDPEGSVKSDSLFQSSNINNFHLWHNTNDHIDNRTNFKSINSRTNESSVCNHLYKLSRLLEPEDTIDENITNSSKDIITTVNTNDSKTITSVNEDQPFYDISDTEEMSEDSIHRVPRGIVNPNYPGFQHLAHTLQEYSSNIENFYHSENEMTDDDNDTDITDFEIKDANENYKELNNNKSEFTNGQLIELSNSTFESTKQSDIPDLLKTISSNNNNVDAINCDITLIGNDIENNFNTKDIIGDFNKEIEDEIKQLLNYNINIQDDLEDLRKDIKDNFEKPIEATINNISEVVNHVIKKLVKNDVGTETKVTSNETKGEVNIVNMNQTNEVNVRMEINLSRPTFLLLDNCHEQIQDAALSDGKEELNLNEDEYDTEKLSNNVETTIKQLSTELRKIIPKLNEMRERDKLWADRPIITDGNSNRVLIKSSNTSSLKKDTRNQTHYESNRQLNKHNYHRVPNKNPEKAQSGPKDPSKYAQHNSSVPRDNINVADSELDTFDVYNIETALPKLDIDTIESYIKAAKEAERRKRNDREEIRKRLAMGIDSEEYYSLGHTDRPGKKPSLHSRLQNGKNLQICFMNETASDNESQCSDLDRSFSSNSKSLSRSSVFSKSSYNHPYQTRPLSVNITKQDKVNTVQSGFKLHPASLISKSSKTRSTQSLNHIELKESDFYALQATLQTEARIALAQAKELARIQMEHERRSRPVSPVTEMLRRSMEKANVPLAPDRRRVSRQILTDMNIAQLQVIVNELHSQIECLNDSLVKLLMARDELHMGQDSMLVDIEDLTRYLGVKEQSKKSKGPTKSGVRRLTALVHK
ncbi:protein PFC0760c isoform X1 [Pieris brassicae]|uniref:protein PFC0760c isoform X1 n=1 Tax=Pieris brassicae TaxID=7116 RepID=UPI001E65F42A|nr:protein PFC0760c isoform X1 [Pieris brassicae]XP_045520139.1 protein PFC0760c isoform X1 [Pieris brassicae]